MDAPLRIALLVNPPLLSAKGGAHAPELARELLGLGHVVRGFGAPPGVIPRSGGELDPGGGSEPLAHGIAGFRPDVVVAYDALSPAAFAGARAARRLGVPLVLVEAGAAAATDRLPSRSMHALGARLWGPYVRRTATRVVALDPMAREQALREGFAERRVEMLPEGVDLTRFRPGLLSAQLAAHRVRGRVLLYAGRLDAFRGLETLIQAFARTVGQRSDWTLVLAGEGPQRRSLRAMVDRLGIGARVAWLPRPRFEELPGLMGGSTLLAVPALDASVRGEQIPRAMACGLPVIASDLPRLRHLVEADGCGLLAAPGDLAAWTSAIERAASSPEARKRWGARARQLAEERFAWPAVAARFARIVEGARAELNPLPDARQERGPEPGAEAGRAADA